MLRIASDRDRAWHPQYTGSAPHQGIACRNARLWAAPHLTSHLPSQQGASVSLKDYRGSWVVLYFYPKDQTPGCTREAHNFQNDQTKYSERHAVVLGVSVDSVDSHKKFCAKEGLNFKLLADRDGKVSQCLRFADQSPGRKICRPSYLPHRSQREGGKSLYQCRPRAAQPRGAGGAGSDAEEIGWLAYVWIRSFDGIS